MDKRFSRRVFLQRFAPMPLAIFLAACGGQTLENILETAQANNVALLPTPECGDDDDPTPPQTEGPFYTPNTPLRTSFIEANTIGTRMILSGLVVSTACVPIAGALVDFWHADDAGVYDNVGYTMRGHQFTDENGMYHLETIVPGLYPGRTRHFHVRVQPANGRILTTQLYFPDEPQNARDGIYSPDLLMSIDQTTTPQQGRFDFVVHS